MDYANPCISAAAFYGFHPVLIPYDKPSEIVSKLLGLAGVDFVVAAAGSLPSRDIRKQSPNVREVMWVVEKTSSEVDWTDASEMSSSWHEIVEEQGAQMTSELPANAEGDKIADFITMWLDESPTSGEIVAFTQKVHVPGPTARS